MADSLPLPPPALANTYAMHARRATTTLTFGFTEPNSPPNSSAGLISRLAMETSLLRSMCEQVLAETAPEKFDQQEAVAASGFVRN